MTPWREYKKKKKYPKLDRDLSVDVVIIGGGMAGVLNAYQLSKAGLKVALLEKKELGSYATMDTTAFITEVIDSDLSQVAEIFSPQIAKMVWQSGRAAIEEFDKVIKAEKISCEFVRCPNFVFASTKRQAKDLDEEYKHYKRLKLEASREENGEKLGFENFGYLEVPRQAKFHPAKFLYALAEKAVALGAEIFEQTEALEIEDNEEENGAVSVLTRGSSVTAEHVIIATYKPLTNEQTHLKKAMYRSYVFEVEVPKNAFQEALYEDMGNPYYYFRIDQAGGEHDRMIIGGEDHKDIFGQTLAKKSFKALGEYLSKLMDGRRYWIVKKWNGPILEPTDGLPLIGEIAPHRYVATGFSGNGMTYSMISSLLLRDLILGPHSGKGFGGASKKNDWEKAYDPTRTLLHPKRLATKAGDYIEEFFAGAIKNLLK